jgi:hypothetical protein
MTRFVTRARAVAVELFDDAVPFSPVSAYGRLSAGHARALIGTLAQHVVEARLSVRQTERLVRSERR